MSIQDRSFMLCCMGQKRSGFYDFDIASSSMSTSQLQRPTRELLLLAMLDDKESGNRRGVTEFAKHLHLSRSAIEDQLSNLARENFVDKKQRGHWYLTDDGYDYALACRPSKADLPHYGRIAAGEPILMPDEPLDSFTYPGLNPNAHFVMQVVGDSMLHEHICEGDTIIFRRVNGWSKVHSHAIIAAGVPEHANVEQPDWLENMLKVMNRGDMVSDIVTDHVTLKKLDSSMTTLIGRYGSIHTVFRPIGIVVQVIRHYDSGRVPHPK